jgi:hypothetical protein
MEIRAERLEIFEQAVLKQPASAGSAKRNGTCVPANAPNNRNCGVRVTAFQLARN